jgi:hypothetical protein
VVSAVYLEQSSQRRKIMKHLRLVALFGLLLVLGLASAVSAKTDVMVEDPDEEWGDLENPTAFPAPQYFMTIFGQIGAEDDIDVLQMDFEDAADDWQFEIMVSDCAVNFQPKVALIGLGEDVPEDLPFELPEGMGATVYDLDLEDSLNVSLFEWEYQGSEIYSVDFPAAGTYYLAIWEADGDVGAYTLTTGSEHPKQIDWTNDKDRQLQLALGRTWNALGCDSKS